MRSMGSAVAVEMGQWRSRESSRSPSALVARVLFVRGALFPFRSVSDG